MYKYQKRNKDLNSYKIGSNFTSVLVRFFMNKSLCTNILTYSRMFYQDFRHYIAC